jgi:hypothetical protein
MKNIGGNTGDDGDFYEIGTGDWSDITFPLQIAFSQWKIIFTRV